MAFGNVPRDAGSIPISSVYVPGVGFVALQGSTTTNTDGSGNQSAAVALLAPDSSTSGTVTNNNDAVSLALPGGQATALIQITGTFVGTLNFEASPDSGTTWYSVQASVVGGSTIATTATAVGAWRCNISGFTNFRVRFSPVTSGTATIGIRLSAGVHNVFVNNVSTASSGALSSVAGSTSSVTILAANASRKGMLLYNDSSSAMYLAYAATATTSAYTVKIPAAALFELPVSPTYTGVLSALWDSASGNARITEVS